MSKEAKKEAKEVVKETSTKEVIENLQAQLKDYREKAEYFKTMAIKAEGAIEVLSQLEKGKNE
jgi:3-mercaptopyruvate sulfurtransferase SseA